jgi:hypothetical protein
MLTFSVFVPPLEQPLFLLERVAVSGFHVMFFEARHALKRIGFGLCITLCYMVALLTFRPYVRRELTFLAAIGAQMSLVFAILVALWMQIFDELADRFELEDAREIMNFDGPEQVGPRTKKRADTEGL